MALGCGKPSLRSFPHHRWHLLSPLCPTEVFSRTPFFINNRVSREIGYSFPVSMEDSLESRLLNTFLDNGISTGDGNFRNHPEGLARH